MLKALFSQGLARVLQMDTSKAEQIKAHARAIAKLVSKAWLPERKNKTFSHWPSSKMCVL